MNKRFRNTGSMAAITSALALVGAPVASGSSGPPPVTPPPGASCLGTLSAAAGQNDIRDDFAPLPGEVVAVAAQDTGNLFECLVYVPAP